MSPLHPPPASSKDRLNPPVEEKEESSFVFIPGLIVPPIRKQGQGIRKQFQKILEERKEQALALRKGKIKDKQEIQRFILDSLSKEKLSVSNLKLTKGLIRSLWKWEELSDEMKELVDVGLGIRFFALNPNQLVETTPEVAEFLEWFLPMIQDVLNLQNWKVPLGDSIEGIKATRFFRRNRDVILSPLTRIKEQIRIDLEREAFTRIADFYQVSLIQGTLHLYLFVSLYIGWILKRILLGEGTEE